MPAVEGMNGQFKLKFEVCILFLVELISKWELVAIDGKHNRVSIMNQSEIVNRGGGGSPQFFRVLMMGEDDQSISNWEEALRFHGCLVQVCRNHLEFMLFLEHEAFNLIIIFEGIANQPDIHAAFLYLKETRKGTPVMVIKQSEWGGSPSAALKTPN